MKTVLFIFAILMTSSLSAAEERSKCAEKAYRQMTELFQAMWDDVEKDMSVVHPEMLKIFEPQMRRTEIGFNPNLLSVVYFLEKNPEKINLTLPMTAWPPGRAECVYYDGIEHICTDESALNELLLDDSFKKLYEERAAAKREVDAVKNKDEF